MNVEFFTCHCPNLAVKNAGNSFRILSNMKGNDVGVVLLGLRLISWFTLWRVMG